MAVGESSGGTGKDEVALGFGSEILNLDLDFLGEDGFG